MILKYYIIMCLIKVTSSEGSFTILLDTTESMQEEIDIIKANIGPVINIIANQTIVKNYIIVPFNDPDIGPPVIASTVKSFISSLNNVNPSGGSDCPENSMTGIIKALEVSNTESYIFMFTDAYAKDLSKFITIENLCRSTRSRVIIFISGSCATGPRGRETGNIDAYYDVARVCSGVVFRFDFTVLRKAFTVIKEMALTEWSDIVTHDTFSRDKEFKFSVDAVTKEIMIVVAGEYPELQIMDSNGFSAETKTLVHTKNSSVIRLENLTAGEHRAIVRCRGTTSATFYKRNQLPFQYGFSTKLPRNMRETCNRPIPGWNNYILIEVSQSHVELRSIEIEIIGRNENRILKFEKIDNSDLYKMQFFIEPDQSFRIIVKYTDTATLRVVTGSTNVVKPQKSEMTADWIKPTVEMIENVTLVDYGANVTMACKNSLLEIPLVHISYLTLENASENSTLKCRAKNSQGEDFKSLQMYVKRNIVFKVLKYPSDQTFQYGDTGTLYCKVEAYPEAKIRWYHNNTILENSDSIKLQDERLIIKNMSLENVGEYKCVISNDLYMKTYTGVITIAGLETPEIAMEKTEIVSKPGDWLDLECRIVKGKPAPEIVWQYKSEKYGFQSIPDGVSVENGRLKIPSIKTEHKGVFKCEAANIVGQDSREIIIKVEYPPIIRISDMETVTVKEGDIVELICDVDAMPKATVRWELRQNNIITMFDERHITNDKNTHRFNALWKDIGEYRCYAENLIGKAEKNIFVNVLVAPYIRSPTVKTKTVKSGASVDLDCTVLYGNPVPLTKWEFIAKDSSTKILARGNSSIPLHLGQVTRAQEGIYLCIADNEVGTDRIRLYLVVE